MSATTAAVTRALSFGYRPREGSLQRSRATVATGWMLALGLVVALFENPFVLLSLLGAVFATAFVCRVARDVAFAVLISTPLALLMAIVNPVASQQGLTVIASGVSLPLLGSFDITREAVVYGLILGLRAIVIFAIAALYVCTVDPDELLRVLRRFSVRSAITASLAVRLVPVLARDGERMAEARACRPGDSPSAATVVRATFARSIDRAGDAAIALETRGYALAEPLRTKLPQRTRADFLVIASATGTAALAVTGKAAGLAVFVDYPLTYVASSPRDLLFCCALAATALAGPLAAARAHRPRSPSVLTTLAHRQGSPSRRSDR